MKFDFSCLSNRDMSNGRDRKKDLEEFYSVFLWLKGFVQREKINERRKMDVGSFLIPPTFHSIHNSLRTDTFKSWVPLS